MATTVKITETYDMKTTVGKVGLVGVHTPQLPLLKRLYPGLLKNHKYFRFVKCDVVGACASVLPADPLQVGVDAGDVAPEDMFNPILYSAVTNESWDTIVQRIRAMAPVENLGSVDAGEMAYFNDADSFNKYYGLLAENGKWRKVMPQSGFKISNLVPLAHTLVSNYGNVGPISNDTALAEDGETPVPIPDLTVPLTASGLNAGSDTTQAVYFRGKSVRMPKFPCHVGVETNYTETTISQVPKTMVLAMIIPPARLHEFYYRMRVSWTIRFERVCSTLEAGNGTNLRITGENSYGSNYTYTDSKVQLQNSSDTVSSDDVSINKIMES